MKLTCWSLFKENWRNSTNHEQNKQTISFGLCFNENWHDSTKHKLWSMFQLISWHNVSKYEFQVAQRRICHCKHAAARFQVHLRLVQWRRLFRHGQPHFNALLVCVRGTIVPISVLRLAWLPNTPSANWRFVPLWLPVYFIRGSAPVKEIVTPLAAPVVSWKPNRNMLEPRYLTLIYRRRRNWHMSDIAKNTNSCQHALSQHVCQRRPELDFCWG